ncbi:molybdopterin-dependent oxidoreductase [Paracoccaceae bacterium Fryx2]|nr:molybdopterin-dependent oxidoreductase [Paracoccaceae bacterium Fryx2]
MSVHAPSALSLLAAVWVHALPGKVSAFEPLPSPTGEVILHVSGRIGVTNDAGAARFDLDMLQGLGAVSVSTSTPWTSGVIRFTGVPLSRVLDRVGAQGDTVVAIALNDYQATIPRSDAVEGGPILAFARDDVEMTVRDMGPLWVVYPYDADPAWQTAVIHGRSVWQLNRLDIRP